MGVVLCVYYECVGTAKESFHSFSYGSLPATLPGGSFTTENRVVLRAMRRRNAPPEARNNSRRMARLSAGAGGELFSGALP